MSHSLLRKCDFEDTCEINLINKVSDNFLIYLFDCGSNFGFYSLYVASKNKNNKIVAYEASPSTYLEMKKNIALNDYKSIKTNNLAVSNIEGANLDFFESEKDWESSISQTTFKKKSKIRINTTTLDIIAKKQNFDDYAVIIKLDVEGHELNVIDGGLSLIQKCSPLIILEFSKFIGENKHYNYSYLKDFLIEYNYDIYNTKYEKISLETTISQIESLPKNMYGIGNKFSKPEPYRPCPALPSPQSQRLRYRHSTRQHPEHCCQAGSAPGPSNDGRWPGPSRVSSSHTP